MHPLFFGPPDSPLYGVYHMPEMSRAREVGAVVCPPILAEYTKSRRAIRALSERLAKAGVHVLRFDYYGMGDSAGSGLDSTVERWIADAGAAVEELKASRGLAAVGLVGMRLGASLALLTALRRDDVPFLVLWEPIVKGLDYVKSLRTLHADWVRQESLQHPSARDRAAATEILGAPFPPQLESGLAAVDLCQGTRVPAERILLVNEGTCDHFQLLGQRFAEAGALTDSRRIPGGNIWSQELYSEKSQVPREVIGGIVDWVAKETA